MPERGAALSDFLCRAGWGAARRAPLAGDASHRRYERLSGGPGDATAVLMDAPPDRGEDVRPFLTIARHLTGQGFSAPAILAADVTRGFLLLEDLGDALFAHVVARRPDDEDLLYAAAVDLLARLHRAPVPEVPAYDVQLMTDLACLPFEWYLTALDRPAPDREIAAFRAEMAALLAEHAPPSVLILRDYHAENLIWLPDRDGVARVGLLDFQDAMLGHPAYDLVSLLEDARRDVAPALQDRMRARYVAATGADGAAFARAYALVGAQRNLRILGVFVRLCRRDGKPGYLPLLPRVWTNLMADLDHPALSGLRDRLLRLLPPPTPARLEGIARQCAPTP